MTHAQSIFGAKVATPPIINYNDICQQINGDVTFVPKMDCGYLFKRMRQFNQEFTSHAFEQNKNNVYPWKTQFYIGKSECLLHRLVKSMSNLHHTEVKGDA